MFILHVRTDGWGNPKVFGRHSLTSGHNQWQFGGIGCGPFGFGNPYAGIGCGPVGFRSPVAFGGIGCGPVGFRSPVAFGGIGCGPVGYSPFTRPFC